MLESLLSQVLTKYLGKYVKGLDGNNLNLAIWKGDVALYNLELKIEAFQEIDFLKAVTLKSGIVGKLNLKIPWSNLRSEPINCILEDVYAVLEPNLNFTWDEAAETKKEQEDKLLRVKQLEAKSKGKELAIDASKTTTKTSEEGESFFSSLATKIIDNIQLSIKNVHIRYEDSNTNVNNPFNIGIFLEDFSVLSTDPNFIPAFLTESHSIIYKLLTLKNLAVYWNSNEQPLSFSSNIELAQLLQKQIAGEQQYLIHPISLSVKAIVNKNHEDSSIPQITGDILVNDITLSLSEIQYKDILNAVDFYAKSEKRWKNRKLRPKVSVKEDPKAWWKYAFNATTCEYKTHNYKWSKAYIEQRRKDRLSYVLLYKDLLKKNQIPRDKITLDQLEEKLSAEDIVFFRSLAKQELKRDGYPVELLEAALDKDKSATSNWYSWLSWGGSSTPTTPQTGEKEPGGSPLPQLSKEQREEIFSAIEYHATPNTTAASIQTKWPRDAIKFQFAFQMQSGNMLLLGSSRETLGAVRFKGFEIGCKVYEEAISVGASLRDTQIHDHCTVDSLFPLIMSPINKDERVFDLLFKYKPFDEPGTDIYVYMNSQPLRIVYSKQWVDRIITFFSVPSQDVVTPSSLQVRNFTKSFEEKFQEKYQRQLETAIESRQNLCINVTIQAPQIIIPQNVTSKESVLIIADFGKLSIIKTLDIDQNHIENLIYSTFRINMNSLHLFTTTSDQLMLMDTTDTTIQCDYIIHDFNVDFSVQVCTIDDLELPKIRVFGNLPSLQLSVSNKLIKQIYLVLNAITENTVTSTTSSSKEHRGQAHNNPNEVVSVLNEKGTAQANSTKAEIALSINLLSIVLKQEDGADLVKVSFEKLGAHAVQRTFDIKFDIVLQYFYIEDCLQKGNEEFKYLVASNRDESQPLIKISYYYIQKESPSYELIDSLVYVNMNALYIMFNRTTIVQLIQFFNVVSSIFSSNTITTSTSSPNITSIKASTSNPNIKRSASTLGASKTSHNKRNSTTLKLTVNLQSIRLTLNKEGQKLGICAIEDAVVVCSLKEKSMQISGILGKLKFQDVSIANKVNDIIIIQEGEDLIQFEYKTFDPEDRDYPNYGKSISVQINTIRFLYLESFISSIQKYFMEISEMQQLVSSTTTYATGVVNDMLAEQNNVNRTESSIKTKSISNIKFEVLANNPQVMIPCTASNTYILADFGQIYVINKFKLESEPVEEITVNVHQLNLQYLEVKSQTESNYLILENTDVTVAFFRPLYGSTSPIKLYIDIPKLGILLDEDKLFVIIDTYKQFFPPQPNSSGSSPSANKDNKDTSNTNSVTNDLLQMQLSLNVGIFNISMYEMKVAETKENVFPLDLIQLTSDTDVNSNDISEDAFIKMHIKGRDLDKKHKIGSKSDAYLLISRYSGNLKVQIYKSETINNSLNPKWKNFIIPAKDIRNEETIIFEVLHNDPMKTSDSLIGSFETTLNALVSMKHIELINRDIKLKKKEYRNSGVLDILTLEIIDTNRKSSSSTSNTYKKILKQQYSASTSNSTTPSFTPSRSLDVSTIVQNQATLVPKLLATLNFSQVGLKFAKTAKTSYLISTITLMELLDGRDDTEIKRIFLLDNFSLRLDIKEKLMMELAISRFCCNVLFDPILPVYDFIMNAVNRFSAVDNNNKTLSPSDSTSSTSSSTNTPASTAPQFELFLSLDRFESYIFSTPSENDVSNRKLIMRNQLLVKYFMKDKEQRAEVLLDKFQISRQIYSLEENTVIPPTTISINSTNILNKSSLSVDILPNLTLALSYQDISLIQQLIASFYSAPRKLLNTSPTTTTATPVNNNTNNEFQIDVEFQDIIIDLVNESPDIPPLVRFELQGPKFKGNFSQNLMQKFLIKSYYYNLQRAVWEPLIEPWYFSFVYQNGTDNTTMTIKSTQLLDITVSSTFLKETLNLWYKDLISITSSKKFCPLSIRNQTLTSIYFKFNESSEEEEELAASSQQSITSLHTNRLNNKKVVYDQVCLNIRVGDFTMSNLNILEEGIIPLKHSKQFINDNLIYQVEFNKGQRIITFGSNIILYNKSSLPLQVKVEDTEQSSSYIMTVPVLEHDSVPIDFISNGSIYFRPLKEDNKPLGNTWSSPKLDCNTLTKMSTCISVMNLDQGEFNYNVRIEEQKVSGITVYSIHVYAPLVIENVYSDSIKYKLIGNNETTGIIKKGESLTTYAVNITQLVKLQIQIPDFFDWSDVISLNDVANPPFTFLDEQKNTFNLFYDKSHVENTLHLTLYSKYWIINRTEFNLIYYQNKELSAGQSTKLQQVRSLENYSNRDWFNFEAATKPTIFNFSSNKCSIQVENGGVSKPVSFSAIQEGEIMIKDSATKKQFYLGISVAMAPTKYRRTKLVTISPRYLLVNKSQEIIYYQQVGNDQRFTLNVDQVAPYHYIDRKGVQQLSISMDLGNKWRWSGGFPLGNIGSFYVNLIHISTNEIYFMRVDISVDRGTIIIIFRPKSKDIAPYRIENKCKEPISFWQDSVDEIIHNLEPNKSVFYAFDEITKPHYIYIKNDEYQFKHRYSLNKIKKHNSSKLSIEVFPDGPTKVFRIQPATESFSDSIDRPSTSSSSSSSSSRNSKKEAEKSFQTISVIELDSIGLSIVDSNPREIAYVYFEGLYATYTQSKSQTSLQVSLKTFQIDNQLYFTPYPTVLRPINSEVDVFRASIVKSNEYPTIEFYNYFSILLQELDISIDSSWLNEMLKFADFNGASQFDKQSDDSINTQFVTDWNDTSRIIYFEIIHINPLKLNVSYYSPERNLQNLSEEQGQIELFVGGIIDKIPNMENASIKLNSLLLEYPSGTQQEIVSRISSHYVSQAIRESYKILGSFEFLGNPINTVSNLGTGIKDFFYEPLHGILLGPEEFKKGLSKGAKSLLKGTVYGLFNASSKITQGISKGFATISLDQEYQIERSKKSAHKPDNIKDGFKEAGKDLGKGVFEGITGLITQPVKGVKQEGVIGLFKGVGRGIVGVGVKPTAGIFDAFSNITQGISNRMIKKNVHRIRFPRHIGKEKILESYSPEKAFRQLLITVLKDGKYNREIATYHIILDKKLYLVTNVHLFCLNNDNYNINWKVRYPRIASIQKKQTDVIVKEGKVSKEAKIIDSNEESPVSSSQLARLRGADKVHTIRTNDEQLATQVYTTLNDIWSTQATSTEPTIPSSTEKRFSSIFKKEDTPKKQQSQQQLQEGTPPDEEKKKGGLLSRLRRKNHD